MGNFVKSDGQVGVLTGFSLVILLIALPNGIMLAISEWIGVDRPVINFDYAVVVLLLLLIPRPVVVVFFLGAFFVDGLSLVRQILPVVNVLDSLYLLSFINIAPAYYKFAFYLFILVAIVVSVVIWVSRDKLSKVAVAGVVNVLLIAYVAGMFFDDSYRGDYRAGSLKFIDSQYVVSYESGLNGFVEQFSVNEPVVFEEKPAHGATLSWFEDPEAVGDKVLLVISESWGWSDEEILKGVLKPLISNKSKLSDFKFGKVGAIDVTVQGEMRELCRLRPVFFNLKNVQEGLEDCLPNLYKDLGYKTLALHAATGAMYARKYWYPKVGFEKALFFENKSWSQRCYSFPGGCDVDFIPNIVEYFSHPDKAFAYWLTLNTHSPYDKRDLKRDVFNCSVYGIDEDKDTCRNLKLHAQFFANLAELLEVPSMQGVRVMVVGDHPPLIRHKDERNNFIKYGNVSWVSFVIGANQNHYVNESVTIR